MLEMSDLIAWYNNQFYDVIEVNYENYDNALRYIKINNGDRLYVGHEKFELIKHIGKKDISDKKIYADCSIVEFEDVHLNLHKGYFQYSNTSLKYFIRLLCGATVDYDFYRYGNFKIIDTIQENKLGLI